MTEDSFEGANWDPLDIDIDKSVNSSYNTLGDNVIDPIIRAWIGQLIGSKELAHVLERYRNRQIDVVLSASRGRAVLRPKITFR